MKRRPGKPTRPPDRPIIGRACNRCDADTDGRGCTRCGCPEFRILRDPQGRLFDQDETTVGTSPAVYMEGMK